jgi:hypothetical protein
MPQITEPTSASRHLEAQREILSGSLDSITSNIGVAMRDSGLTFPIYIAVPTSGIALATIATSLDRSDEDWEQVRAIVNGAVGKAVGLGRLRMQAVACVVANAALMSAADVTV